mmetsp:Transcript_108721/g.215908  ORF Transcript_108721/g.215908 Transcript_108721/m.215908 type:complete len:543 (-) Transcript_108721:53-1681(-)
MLVLPGPRDAVVSAPRHGSFKWPPTPTLELPERMDTEGLLNARVPRLPLSRRLSGASLGGRPDMFQATTDAMEEGALLMRELTARSCSQLPSPREQPSPVAQLSQKELTIDAEHNSEEEEPTIDAQYHSEVEELLDKGDSSPCGCQREISRARVLSGMRKPIGSAMVCLGLLLCALVAVLSVRSPGMRSTAEPSSAQAMPTGGMSTDSSTDPQVPTQQLQDTGSYGTPRALVLGRVRGGAPGVIDEVYTYGAPAVSDPPIENYDREDRCFLGVRCYTEDTYGVHNESSQVDAATIANDYKHAKMPVAALHWHHDSVYIPCPGAPELPLQSGNVPDWGLHVEHEYMPRLQRVRVNGTGYRLREPFLRAADLVVLAYKSYDSTPHAMVDLSERLPNWRLVAKEIRMSGKGSLRDTDPVMIAQELQTLDCAIVFTGTNNLGNELTTSTTSYATDYCGFLGVHVGYRNELWQITNALFPRLRPKLERCNRVICVGHSMGGSLCELFAGCANRKAVGEPDYEQQKWLQGTPELMPEIDPNKVQVVRN